MKKQTIHIYFFGLLLLFYGCTDDIGIESNAGKTYGQPDVLKPLSLDNYWAYYVNVYVGDSLIKSLGFAETHRIEKEIDIYQIGNMFYENFGTLIFTDRNTGAYFRNTDSSMIMMYEWSSDTKIFTITSFFKYPAVAGESWQYEADTLCGLYPVGVTSITRRIACTDTTVIAGGKSYHPCIVYVDDLYNKMGLPVFRNWNTWRFCPGVGLVSSTETYYTRTRKLLYTFTFELDSFQVND